MRLKILLIILATCLAGSVFAADSDDVFTLYLVRHAEKQSDGTRDPDLTMAGMDRAQNLASWLQDKDITDIWSSDNVVEAVTLLKACLGEPYEKDDSMIPYERTRQRNRHIKTGQPCVSQRQGA